MPNLPLEEQFELLRAQIETAVEAPGIAVIASACQGDGTTATAAGLVKSFASAGHRTLLLTALQPNALPASGRRIASVDQLADAGPSAFVESTGGFDAMWLGAHNGRKAAARASVAKALEACRASYDYVVVDAAQVLESGLSLMLAQYANTLLLTVREGRSIKSADHDVMRILEREEISVLGVVVVAPDTIREAARDAVRGSVSDLPARVTTIVDTATPKAQRIRA